MFRGKWVYIWRLQNIFDGNLDRIMLALKEGDILGVACKLHNGWSSYGYDTLKMQQFREMCREEEIGFIGWGYIYLRYNAAAEGRKAVEMISKYEPDAYLIDAEAEAKGQSTGAKVFTSFLDGIPTPIGLASYRYPKLHPELPWKELRAACDFDSPQVYYRTGEPTAQLARSKREFFAMSPRLPYFPAGDMYFEHGVKPKPEAVKAYLQACLDDPDIGGTLMWSMDQMKITPELWNEFVTFQWETGPIITPGTDITLTPAEVTALRSIVGRL